MTKIELEGGKYTVVHDNGRNFHALRHGKKWRDLTGDGLMLAMAHRIEEQAEDLTILKAEIKRLKAQVHGISIVSEFERGVVHALNIVACSVTIQDAEAELRRQIDEIPKGDKADLAEKLDNAAHANAALEDELAEVKRELERVRNDSGPGQS